ncbi:hypothetical protein MASR2M44_14010 [Bacteroidota bacterium]
MKIVLCNGDSLGMPRENVSFKNTWFYNLVNSDLSKTYCFINNFKRALTSAQLFSKDFLENYNPEIVILQIGIVDCAPRLYKSNSNLIKIINRLPSFIVSSFWKISKKYKKRENKNADVPLDKFRDNMFLYLTRCKNIGVNKCIVIQIQNPGDLMVSKNPEIRESIEKYNTVLKELESAFDIVQLISPLSKGCNEDYIEDGYHVNEHGFRKVFIELEKILNEIR